MRIPCTDIISSLKAHLRKQASELRAAGPTPHLLAILIGHSPAQESYVRIKRQLAESLGISFTFWHVTELFTQSQFTILLQAKIDEVSPTGIIIQHPLPEGWDSEELYTSFPPALDVEGHANKSLEFPLVEAALTALRWIHAYERISIPLHGWLRTKNIVVAGNGITTGAPVSKYLHKYNVPFTQTRSSTPEPDHIYRQADIIITGVGKTILNADNIKPGVTLLNFGLHKDAHGVLVGDYYESAIGEIAAYYTPTPGGLGPIDVLCMYQNLLKITSNKKHSSL